MQNKKFGEWLAFNFEGPLKLIWPTLADINSNKTLFDLFTDSVNRWCGICNTIDDTYTRVFVPNKINNMNVKVLNLISEIN